MEVRTTTLRAATVKEHLVIEMGDRATEEETLVETLAGTLTEETEGVIAEETMEARDLLRGEEAMSLFSSEGFPTMPLRMTSWTSARTMT